MSGDYYPQLGNKQTCYIAQQPRKTNKQTNIQTKTNAQAKRNRFENKEQNIMNNT